MSGLLRSSAVMAAGTVASRLLGFLRAATLLAVVGTGVAADAFDVANSLPNQFYLLLAGGVLNAVLVPQITKAATHPDGGDVFVNRLLTLAFAMMAGATVAVTAMAPLLVRLYSQGWEAETLWLATAFALICLPQVLFYGLYTLLGQVLNARGRFAAYMWAPTLANLVAIGGLLWFRSRYPRRPPVEAWSAEMIWVLAGTATLGVAVQALFLIVPLRRSGFRYRPMWGLRGVGLGSASRVAMWTFAAIGVSQLGFVVTSKVLTLANDQLTEQGIVGAGKAAYSGAFLLFMLPHSLVTVSLVTALFTRLSTAAHAGRTDEVVADLHRGLRLPAVVLVPASVAVLFLGTPAVHVAFFGNSRAETEAIAHVMIAMMTGLVPFGWLYLIQRVHYAFEDARTPFLLQLVVTAVATVVNLSALFLHPVHTGVVVGVGQSLSNLVAALLGFALLRRLLGPLDLARTVRTYARLLLASAVAALPSWASLRALSSLLPEAREWEAVSLAGSAAAFAVVTLLLAWRLGVPEVAELLSPLSRRVRRGRAPGARP
jgi:putative peptidoglycan lipid II flippase